MAKSLPYQEFLISHLKEPSYAAGYIEALFAEKNPEPELIRLVLLNVAEALSEQNMTPEQAKLHLKKLDELLSQCGSEAIYNLGTWLNSLGLKLTVTVADKADHNITI
jgi:DNA-binding phage protein